MGPEGQWSAPAEGPVPAPGALRPWPAQADVPLRALRPRGRAGGRRGLRRQHAGGRRDAPAAPPPPDPREEGHRVRAPHQGRDPQRVGATPEPSPLPVTETWHMLDSVVSLDTHIASK